MTAIVDVGEVRVNRPPKNQPLSYLGKKIGKTALQNLAATSALF